MLDRLTRRLHRFAEMVAAALLAAIFIAFIAQIVMRYVFDWPVGWTTELSLIAWLWLILWGASFVLKDDEEIRIDLLTHAVPARVRRVLAALASVCVIALFALSLPASWSYVSFMKVEHSSYLHIRMDWLYSIYLVFVVAVILRCLRTLGRALRREPIPAADPTTPSSAL
jgi:TRAP-type C4-dicarboxylate transport system permease small subunit